MGKWLTGGFVLVATLVMSAGVAHAQNAQITGIVRDTSGGVMPGVTVTARNIDTGLTRVAVSDGNGTYALPALPPGRYDVSAEIPGFDTGLREAVQLVIDQTATLNFSLRPATLAETLTVVAEAPIVDISRSDVSTSVTSEQIQDLPVATRRWLDLAMLTPGTSQDNIRGQFYRGNVNIGAGTREYSNAFVVDGVNNNWAQMGEARQNFAMDSIREFRVATSTYKAEFGLATGGVVSVVSKSGTNSYQGSAFAFFRDKALTAKTVFETERPEFKRWQLGSTIGGPIVRDRTHFFFAYERTDEDQFFTVNTRGVWPEFDDIHKSAQERWTYTAKVDHQITPNQTMFVRFAAEKEYRPIVNAGGTRSPSASFDFAVPRDSLVIGHTWVASDRLLNDFRFQRGFAKYIVSMPRSNGDWAAGDFGPDRLGLCTPSLNYPSLLTGTCNSQMGPETRWQFKNDTSYRLPSWGGSHQLKFGVDFSYITFQGDNTGNLLGTFTFPTDRPYDPNDPQTFPTQYTQSLPTFADVPVRHFAVYLQDDWQPMGGLTFNLGLRWDLQHGVFNEDIPGRLNRIEEVLGPGRGYPLPIPFHEGSDRRGDRNNFGPRAGFAYDPTGTGDTNIHGAYGLFYDNIRTLTTTFGELTWPQAQSIVIRNPSFPDPFQGRSREEFLSTAPPNISVLDNDYVNSYAHQFNVGMTQRLRGDLAISADVTMVERRADRDIVDINLPDQVSRVRPYPQFARINFSQATSDNRYRALLLKLEKRMNRNYQYLASYTLSSAEDMPISNASSDFYGFQRISGAGAGDRRHRLVLSSIVRLPWNAQLSAVADFRSSLPFNPTTSFDLNNDGYTGDLPPGVGFRSGCRDLNLDALNSFRVSRGLGSVSSSDVSCPGYANLDLRFSKNFVFAQSQRFELIAQLFNVFNRANFATPVSNPTAALFGQVNQLMPNINAPSRQAEIAIRYVF
jgi:hypothetical protein